MKLPTNKNIRGLYFGKCTLIALTNSSKIFVMSNAKEKM